MYLQIKLFPIKRQNPQMSGRHWGQRWQLKVADIKKRTNEQKTNFRTTVPPRYEICISQRGASSGGYSSPPICWHTLPAPGLRWGQPP